MTSENINLSAELRNTGKSTNRRLRREKRVPAVVYGPKVKNIEFSLEEKEMVKYLKSKFENTIFKLTSDDKNLNGLNVLRKATDIHPVSRRPTHIDFYALDLTATVEVTVEVKFEGDAIGIKNGGVLNVAHRDVDIECLPSDIPEYLAIDISNLDINDSVHVSDLVIPTGVTVLTPLTQTVCTIATVAEEAEPVVAAAAEGEAAEAAPAGDGEKKEDAKKE